MGIQRKIRRFRKSKLIEVIFKNLFDLILFFLGFRKTAIVSGYSMLPYLKDGEIVFFKIFIKGKSKPKPGQVIIFEHPLKNIICIKRIGVVNQNNIDVIGDNIEFSEDSNKFGLLNYEKIIGIVTSKLIFSNLKDFLIQKNKSTSLNPK